jgi:UDP-N-acetylglucosamine/UDP-N-acetylgalactosamine diphosphorylase
MHPIPNALQQHLRHHGQEHVLTWWDQLTDDERRALVEQVQALDLSALRQLYEQREHAYAVPSPERIAPVPVVAHDSPHNAVARQHGEQALRAGEVAVLLVAGGQGSRLGFEHPKGMFAVGPVSGKSLFQMHAEKVLATQRRYGKPLPFLVMTSPATDAETRQFFAEHHYFDLPAAEVFFFQQGTMPALDLATGILLMEQRGQLFLSPDGHGGTLTALADSGLLDRLKQRGVRHIFYSQIDNPLVKIADPTFLGHHLTNRSEASSKIVAKRDALEKVGVFAQVDGRCMLIEYSDLPEELARQTDETGKLRLWAGNPAIHIFDVAFLERVTRGAQRIPFHVAKKKVPHLGDKGQSVQPSRENALKFERFIFDVLPLAERWTLVETLRHEEFAPLKNATGADSPESVRRALCNLAADWLERAGVEVPRDAEGNAKEALEISPLLALDADELAAKLKDKERVRETRYFTP